MGKMLTAKLGVKFAEAKQDHAQKATVLSKSANASAERQEHFKQQHAESKQQLKKFLNLKNISTSPAEHVMTAAKLNVARAEKHLEDETCGEDSDDAMLEAHAML